MSINDWYCNAIGLCIVVIIINLYGFMYVCIFYFCACPVVWRACDSHTYTLQWSSALVMLNDTCETIII